MAFLIALKYKPNIRQKEFNLQTKVEDPYNDNKIHVSLLLLIATSDTTYLSFSDYATTRPASSAALGTLPARVRTLTGLNFWPEVAQFVMRVEKNILACPMSKA